jgi:riboflavin transporter FmnP
MMIPQLMGLDIDFIVIWIIMSYFLLDVRAVKLLLRERSWWLVVPLGIRVTFFVQSVGIVLTHSRSLWRKRDMLGV